MKFTNLENTIKELNSPTVYEDGETLDSQFNFKYRMSDNHIEIYDANEQYYMDYLEETNCLLYECSMEFGFEYEPEREDKIFTKLETAIKKDLGEDKYIEWEDNVVMSVYF